MLFDRRFYINKSHARSSGPHSKWSLWLFISVNYFLSHLIQIPAQATLDKFLHTASQHSPVSIKCSKHAIHSTPINVILLFLLPFVYKYWILLNNNKRNVADLYSRFVGSWKPSCENPMKVCFATNYKKIYIFVHCLLLQLFPTIVFIEALFRQVVIVWKHLSYDELLIFF